MTNINVFQLSIWVMMYKTNKNNSMVGINQEMYNHLICFDRLNRLESEKIMELTSTFKEL